MTSNYEAITQNNIERRGTEFADIGRLISEQLYSDSTHFVYELIQNAEDALSRRYKASPDCNLPNSIEFNLFKDKLELRHFGQPFDESDVKAISDVLKGTKTDDEQQIGRFGIGFKSVYAFTSTPEIHSGTEHFLLTEFIKIEEVSERKIAEGETLFIFPFNHHKESPEKTYRAIREKFLDLDATTILFLRNLSKISWFTEDGQKGSISKFSDHLTRNCTKVRFVEGNRETSWIVFSRTSSENKKLKAEVAFKLNREGLDDQEKIVPIIQSPLIAFLPTELKTNLRFLVNGPYLTTPARDNILKKEESNNLLIQLTAELVSEIPLMLKGDDVLKKLNLLNLDFYRALPIRREDFEEKSLFLTVFHSVKKAFLNYNLLPSSREGNYISASKAKLAGSSELRELVNETQLSLLLGTPAEWISAEITERGQRTSEFYRYLRDVLRIEEIEPENFSRKISISFLEKQDDVWISRLYSFWESQSAIIKSNILRNKPIIRLENNSHVQPFAVNGRPNVYLPTSEDDHTGFPTVKRNIFGNALTKNDALSFLRKLGIVEPDWIAIVTNKILPKYRNFKYKFSPNEHEEDLSKIFKAIDETAKASPSGLDVGSLIQSRRRSQLIADLKKINFVRAYNAANPLNKTYMSPSLVYVEDPNLTIYFKGNPNIWFLDEPEEYTKKIEKLGVRADVKIKIKNTNSDGHVILKEEKGNHQRGIAGFDKDFEIDGLKHAMKDPSIVKSAYIWNYLLRKQRHILCIHGIIEKSSTKTYTRKEPPIKCPSLSGRLLLETSWLPNKRGVFHLPSEISLDDLHGDFIADDNLAKLLARYLGMMSSLAAEEILKKLPSQFRKVLKPEILDFACKNPEKIEALMQEQLSKDVANDQSHNDDKEEGQRVEEIDYRTAFQDAFSKAGETKSNQSPITQSPVSNPDAREQRIEKEIAEERMNSSDIIRFKRVTSKIWNSKDSAVRHFLLEQYSGRCQICNYTFIKSNGEAYFEGVYIVSYTKASWIDQPGNILCLCANCCAKFKHGSVQVVGDLFDEIDQFSPYVKGGDTKHEIVLKLCGERVCLAFTERHIIATRALLKASE